MVGFMDATCSRYLFGRRFCTAEPKILGLKSNALSLVSGFRPEKL